MCRALIALAVLVASLPAGSTFGAAPDLEVASTSGATKWLVAGGTATVTAKVANTGDAPATRVGVRLVLAYEGGGDAAPPLRPGATLASLAAGAGATVQVSGKVPASLTPAAYTLLVCADPLKSIPESDETNNCRSGGTLYVSGPGALERIAVAVASGAIREGMGALYRFYAVTGDKRLPKLFRGPVTEGEADVVRAVATEFGGFSAAEKGAVLPYLMPPRAADSAWRGSPGRPSIAERRMAAEQGGLCRGFDNLSRPGWKSVPSSNGKALVWYEEGDSAAAASAHTYATALGTKIWPKLVAEFGAPKTDGREGCYHGPDGRLDVYVSNLLPAVAGNERGLLGVTMPYPAQGAFPVAGQFCTNRPAWIAIKAGQDPWVLAHEFMHVLQFSHKYKTCDGVAWWDEGQAVWAADFVYPEADNEHNFKAQFAFGGGVAKFGLYTENYDAWPFWYYLAKAHGAGVLKRIFAQLRAADSATAVNRAIPGGMKAQLPRYAVWNWNDTPVGSSGFPVRKSYKQWDGFDASPFPWASADRQAILELSPQDDPWCFFVANPTRGNCRESGRALEPGQTEFQVLDVSGDDIGEVVIRNALYRAKARDGSAATVNLQAMVKMADGKWKLEDWTNRKEISFCKLNEDEDIDEIVLVQANSYVGNTESVQFGGAKGVTGKFEVRVRDSCDLFFRVTGGQAQETTGGVFRLSGFPCVTTTTIDAPIKWTFKASPQGTIDMRVSIDRSGIGGYLDSPGSVQFPGGNQTSEGPDCSGATISGGTFPDAGPTALISKGADDKSVKLKFIDLIPLAFTPDPPAEPVIGPAPYNCTMPLDKTPPGSIWQDVSLDTLRGNEPFTLSVGAVWAFSYGSGGTGQDCTNMYGYSVNLQRVNEDGSPLE